MTKQTMFTKFAAITLCVMIASPVRADILDVPSQFSTIQSAIDAAIPGDEILVQPGLYFGRLNYLGKDIAIRSSSGAIVTIIDPLGETGPVVTFESGETDLAILDGFTIRNGNSPVTRGGGIFISGSSPRILNCRITANEAKRGGGMSIDGLASPQIEDCVFSSNSTTNFGGGAFVSNSGSGVFLRCVFTDNVANSLGGGLFSESVSTSQFIDCEFSNNQAVQGGGIDIRNSDSMISGSSFVNNTATSVGGGILTSSNISITNCMFDNNTASNPAGGQGSGGAIFFSGTSSPGPTIGLSTFLSNSALIDGGAIQSSFSTPSISNCFFGDNSAGRSGGAISDSNSTSFVTDSIFSCNTAPSGAAYIFSNSPGLLLRCLFRDNQPQTGGFVLFSSGGVGVTIGISDFCGLPISEMLGGNWIDAGGNTFSDDCSPALRADIDCNGIVNVSDLLLLLGGWGPCPLCPSDINLDEVVNVTDLLSLLANWG